MSGWIRHDFIIPGANCNSHPVIAGIALAVGSYPDATRAPAAIRPDRSSLTSERGTSGSVRRDHNSTARLAASRANPLSESGRGTGRK